MFKCQNTFMLYTPQDTVDAVQRWCDDNMMKLNARKCEMMYFPPNKRDNFQPVDSLSATTLKVVDSYKYLGFLLNTKQHAMGSLARQRQLSATSAQTTQAGRA